MSFLQAQVERPTEVETVKIKPGKFMMGADLSPDYITAEKAIFIQDEFPVREVTITRPFEMAKYEVTNAEYERYDPGHAALRGKAKGISEGGNEAVVYVDWNDAVGYCKWLSSHDDHYDYRLPTEAEWEYACRAGTRTPYSDGVEGDIYEMNPLGPLAEKWRVITGWVVTRGNRTAEKVAHRQFEDVDLTVGQQGPNPWGLYDMHGGVEEWTQDWYGPYVASDTIDPVGYAEGTSKVVRGGSHNVHLQTLRSANRSSSNRTDKHFLMGFRVVRVPKGQTLPKPVLRHSPKRWAMGVSQDVYKWGVDSTEPYFELTTLYDMESEYQTPELAEQFNLPLYTHNHSPAITWAENGDVFLAWFTGESEKDQALTVPALRARRQPSGELAWDTEVSEFYKEADRNMHGSQLWNNATRIANGYKEPFTLYLINGICTDGMWSKLAMSFRKSVDNGVTWTEPVMMKQGVDAFHLDSDRNQAQGNVVTASNGSFISFSDGSAIGGSGSSVNYSNDGGETWTMRTLKEGPTGIHVSAVELNDGRILAYSRDNGRTFGSLPESISEDWGRTWSSKGSEFPGIRTVQRSVLMRLEFSDPGLDPDGLGRKPILLVSMANDGMPGRDSNGEETTIFGTFAALSWDEGKTWPVKRVMSNVKSGSEEHVMAPWNRAFTLDATHGQGRSYWAATQTPDGIIHLTDSRLVYSFNLAWFK
jgi:formylglycine-generating enzyme required for sulfatase activity